jgi:hypothetical protein
MQNSATSCQLAIGFAPARDGVAALWIDVCADVSNDRRTGFSASL